MTLTIVNSRRLRRKAINRIRFIQTAATTVESKNALEYGATRTEERRVSHDKYRL